MLRLCVTNDDDDDDDGMTGTLVAAYVTITPTPNYQRLHNINMDNVTYEFLSIPIVSRLCFSIMCCFDTLLLGHEVASYRQVKYSIISIIRTGNNCITYRLLKL